MVSFRTVAASALFVVPAVLADPFTSPSALYARQLNGFDPSTIPASCLQQQCQAFVNTVTTDGCSTLDCLCTNSFVSSWKTCIQCAVSSGDAGTYDQTTGDEDVSAFITACNSAGHPVSSSGSGDSGGSGSSSSGSPAATGSSGAPAATGTGDSTITGGTPSTTTGGTTAKSGAVVGMSVSLVGSILALALGAINFA